MMMYQVRVRLAKIAHSGTAVSAIWVGVTVLCWLLAFKLSPSGAWSPSLRDAVSSLTTVDAKHYLWIADNWYSVDGNDRRLVAFFPVYPLIIRAMGSVTAIPLSVLAVLLSQVFLLVVMLLLRWKLWDFPAEHTAEVQPYMVLALGPCTLFFFVAYAESLFLLLSLVTVYAIHRNNLPVAWIAGFAAGLTRPTAAALCVLFVIEIWQRKRRGTNWYTAGAALAGVTVGISAYLAYVAYLTGASLGYFAVQAQWWGTSWQLPFKGDLRDLRTLVWALSFDGTIYADRIARLAALGMIASLLAFNWRRIPPSWAAYVFVGILWFHSQEPNRSSLRYDAGLFPVYFLGASALSTISRWSAAALIGVPIQAILAVRHFAGKWVA